MIDLALSWALAAALASAAVGAVLGVAHNAPWIYRTHWSGAGGSVAARLGWTLLSALVLGLLWASVGVFYSPAVALAAAWVSWSF